MDLPKKYTMPIHPLPRRLPGAHSFRGEWAVGSTLPSGAIGLSARQARALIFGAQAWSFDLGDANAGLGIIQRGRLGCSLMLTLTPEANAAEAIREDIAGLIAREDVTTVSIRTSSRHLPVPQVRSIGLETLRCSGVKLYVLDLRKPAGDRQLSTNHKRAIGRARKAGVVASWASAASGLEAHFRLTDASMDRRATRGESTTLRPSRGDIKQLLESGSGRLCQARMGNEVLSSKLVYCLDDYAYYHDGGTSPAGMRLGASHFLMHEMARLLSEEGRTSLDMGVADVASGELWRFKAGFDPDLWFIESADFDVSSPGKRMRNLLRNLRLLATQ